MGKEFERILCPTDFSDFSSEALKKAAALAPLFGAKLTLTHIISNPFSKMYLGNLENKSQLNEIVKTVEQMMKDFAEKHLSDVPYTITVKNHEHIYGGIIECAEEDNVDLIIMATRGRTGPKRVFLGSVTESVVRRASCSVLVVRP
jgi:universal stress protein A